MGIDLIPAENAREIRAEYAAITQVIAKDDSPTEWAIMLWALVLL